MMQTMPVKLSVNLNKVALLRNQRDVGYPSVLEAARMVVGGRRARHHRASAPRRAPHPAQRRAASWRR